MGNVNDIVEVRVSLLSRLTAYLGQRFCGLVHGHHEVLHFDGARMLMRCTSCGHDSPGLTVDNLPPTRTYAGDPKRHILTNTKSAVRK